MPAKKTKKKTSSKKKTTKKTPAKADSNYQHPPEFFRMNTGEIQVQEDFNVPGRIPNEELTASVKQNGVLHPVHVRKLKASDEEFSLVDGHRRLAAARRAGIGVVPVMYVGVMTDEEAYLFALQANEDQKSYSKRDRNIIVVKLKNMGCTNKKIAKACGRSESTIAQDWLIEQKGDTRLKQAVQKPVKDGGVSRQVAAQVAALPAKSQRAVLPKVKGKTAAEAKPVVQAEKAKAEGKPAPKLPPKLPPKTGVKKSKFCKDALDRAVRMEILIDQKLSNNRAHRTLLAQRGILEVLFGRATVDDIFHVW